MDFFVFPFFRWFTHYPQFSICNLLFDCPVLDDSCESCESGESRCKDPKSNLFKIN